MSDLVGYAPVDALDPADMEDWSAEQVSKYFDSTKLSQNYSDLIKRRGIDGRVLHTVAEGVDWASPNDRLGVVNMLKGLGIVDVADALKVCHALKLASAPDLGARKRSRKPKHKQPANRRSIENPLTADGYRRTRLEDGHSDSIFYDNPSLSLSNDNPAEQGSAAAHSKGRLSLPAPEWAAGKADDAEDQDHLDKSVLGIAFRTVISWREHLKLMSVILLVSFVYDCFIWLANGNQGLLLLVWFRTSVIDTCDSYNNQKPIRGSGEYLIFLMFLVLFFPWLCSGILGRMQAFFGNSPAAKLAILVTWSVTLAVAYLNLRLVALRCLPYTAIPVLLFPLQLVGDMFTEIVFMDFDMTSPEFWFVMLFDVTLLIMRDADLYEDLAKFVQRKAGRLGQLVLKVGELVVGPDLSSVGSDSPKKKAQTTNNLELEQWNTPPTEKERESVKRELTENW
eukprot:g1998.t1